MPTLTPFSSRLCGCPHLPPVPGPILASHAVSSLSLPQSHLKPLLHLIQTPETSQMGRPVLCTSENRHGAKFIFVGLVSVSSCLHRPLLGALGKLVRSDRLVRRWSSWSSLHACTPAASWLAGLPSFHGAVERLCFGHYLIGAVAGVPMTLRGPSGSSKGNTAGMC